VKPASALNRTLRETISKTGLAPIALSLYEALARANPMVALSNLRFRADGAPDGLPIPPAHLRFLVAGTVDVDWFLRGGALGMESIREVAGQTDAFDETAAILDFGCGCGRVTRFWRGVTKARICGTDYNQQLIEWCQQNLPFAAFGANQLTPPLTYHDREFDLIYAFSVFTHLTEDLQASWMLELTRVLKPEGHLLLSTHGDSYLDRLNDEERQRFAAGNLVVKDDVSAPGSNSCSAYHPVAFVRDQLARDLVVVDFIPEGARGNPKQDLYLLRKS
jgi:SAM-dependent methyltransferase